jgi:hypothetical protein
MSVGFCIPRWLPSKLRIVRGNVEEILGVKQQASLACDISSMVVRQLMYVSCERYSGISSQRLFTSCGLQILQSKIQGAGAMGGPALRFLFQQRREREGCW